MDGDRLKWMKILFVMTMKYTVKRERNLEVRGTFMIPEDYMFSSSDLMRKILSYYFEQKGYFDLLPWLKIPDYLFDTYGIEVFREIKEPDVCKTVLEVIDKDYDRQGGYVEEIELPKNWYEMTTKEVLEIVKSQISKEGQKRTLGRWLGYSATEQEYVRDD